MYAKNFLRALVAVAVLAPLAAASPANASSSTKMSSETKCHMRFSLTEWAVAYEHAAGHGTISCDNGQRADVAVTSKGVGLTAGKFRIEGTGDFPKVRDIHDLYGDYAAAEGDAGLVKAGEAAVVTKGDVSLAIAGHGEGWNVGVSLGRLQLTPTKH